MSCIRVGLFSLVSALLLVGIAPAIASAQSVPINIQSTPPGATVFLDSTSAPALGVTPMTNVRVPRGAHTLIFRLANHEDGRLPITVSRRRETFRIVLNALGTISISAQNDTANGAAVRIDGQPVGNIPYRSTVQPGRHMVQVGREGFVTFTQWVELDGGQVLTLPVSLEREQAASGSILVTSDISGAPIFLDGEPRGTTPNVLENVPPGQHAIELRPSGLPVHRETVLVIAGQRAAVNPQLRPAAPSNGSIRVISNVANTTVILDGEALGTAPVSRDNITPGEHVIEATLDGYQRISQPITVEAGQQRVIALQMQRQVGPPGRIVVNANVRDAQVTIDGTPRGAAPVVIADATPGAHAVIVAADGYEEYRNTCEVGEGRSCELSVELRPLGVAVRVNSNAPGSQLYVDGNLVGPVPYEGTLPAGEHRIEVRAEGFEPSTQQIALTPSQTARAVDVTLVPIRTGPTPQEAEDQAAERQRARMAATTHGAGSLERDVAIIDFSLGWPYLAQLRLSVGILDNLEAGFTVRSFGRLTEFEGRIELGHRPVKQFGIAAQARFGGGIGPAVEDAMGAAHKVNSFFFIAEAMGSLYFGDAASFTLWGGIDVTSDRWDFTSEDSDVLAQAMGEPDRQNQVRLRLGGALDIVMSRYWNFFLELDGILAGPDEDRRILGDIFGLGVTDTELYGRAGFTHKF